MSKALYVLAGYDQMTENYLTKMQNELYQSGFIGTHTKNIPHHITLGSFPLDKEEYLVDLLNTIQNAQSSFEVTFNHVGIFQGGKVLFIAPDCNKKLLNLKEMFSDSYNWTAHTTMLIDDEKTILEALPIVLNHFSSFKGTITSLHLYEFFPTRHIITIHLK